MNRIAFSGQQTCDELTVTRQISQLISITGCLEADESSPPLLLQLLLLSGMEPPLTPPTPEWVAEYPELIWDPDPLIPLTDPEEAGPPTADPAPSGWRSLLKIIRYGHQLNSNSATFFNQASFLKSAFPQTHLKFECQLFLTVSGDLCTKYDTPDGVKVSL